MHEPRAGEAVHLGAGLDVFVVVGEQPGYVAGGVRGVGGGARAPAARHLAAADAQVAAAGEAHRQVPVGAARGDARGDAALGAAAGRRRRAARRDRREGGARGAVAVPAIIPRRRQPASRLLSAGRLGLRQSRCRPHGRQTVKHNAI